jgi:hypothetical protein
MHLPVIAQRVARTSMMRCAPLSMDAVRTAERAGTAASRLSTTKRPLGRGQRLAWSLGSTSTTDDISNRLRLTLEIVPVTIRTRSSYISRSNTRSTVDYLTPLEVKQQHRSIARVKWSAS